VKITEQFFHLGNLAIFELQNTKPLCCSDVTWLKTMAAGSTTVLTDKATCTTGTALEGRAWNDVTQAELEAEPCPTIPDPCRELLNSVFSGKIRILFEAYNRWAILPGPPGHYNSEVFLTHIQGVSK
jgi:hypothetical protein